MCLVLFFCKNYVDIAGNCIGDDEAVGLFDALQNCTGLTTIDISFNCIGEEGAEAERRDADGDLGAGDDDAALARGHGEGREEEAREGEGWLRPVGGDEGLRRDQAHQGFDEDVHRAAWGPREGRARVASPRRRS